MSHRSRFLLFALGLAVFCYLLSQLPLRDLVENARRTGWLIIPILLVYGAVYACYNASWRVVMSDERTPIPFWRSYAITLSGFAINYVTPVVNLGGEPYRIAAATPWLGRRRATGSIILCTMLHGLSHLLIWLTAIALAIAFHPHGEIQVAGLSVLGLILVGLAALLLTRHDQGFLEALLDLLLRLPWLRRFVQNLEARRPALAEIDRQIIAFYRGHRRRFFLALGLEYLGRCIAMLEYVLIIWSVGIHVTVGDAFIIGAFSSLVLNLLFFMPMELGSREGGHYLAFALVGLGPELGIYAALITRLREIVWIGTGILLIWFAGRSTPRTAWLKEEVGNP